MRKEKIIEVIKQIQDENKNLLQNKELTKKEFVLRKSLIEDFIFLLEVEKDFGYRRKVFK